MDLINAAFKQQFETTFGTDGGRIYVIRAPGRVNLIGEHTDYNDGFVLPMAIEPDIRVICRARPDATVRLASSLYAGQVVEFSLQKRIDPGEPKWANYVRGVAAGLIGAGIPLSGMDALITNTLPQGGGLSSSAAIEVGSALSCLTLAGLTMDAHRLALICQRAEHEYAHVPCGIMDQMIVSSAQINHATLYDCRTAEKTYVVLDDKELRVVIANSMVRHELSGGEYAQRRQQCEAGVAFFQKSDPKIKALRDVTLDQLQSAKGSLDELVYRRCRHVITENARTTEAAASLSARRYERMGELMVQSHASLRDDYEVSCAELDFLSAEAMKVRGVYGARMTGGGFGGCIVALVQPRAVETLKQTLTASYQEKFGIAPVIFSTTATAGATVVE